MGAWIEIWASRDRPNTILVAPAWGRGLKYLVQDSGQVLVAVAPAWGRGLKSLEDDRVYLWSKVAPAWGRGLKYHIRGGQRVR